MVEQILNKWKTTLILRDLAEGGLRTLGTCAGALAVLAVLDRLLMLPYPVRLAGAAALAVLAAACAWRWLLKPALRWTPARVFGEADRLNPGLSRILLPAWELGRGLPPGVSADLAAAHRVRAEDLLETMPPLSFPMTPSPRALRSAAAAAFGLLLVTVLTDQPSRWERLLAPWRRVPLETLLEFTGDARVSWGSPVTLEARWRQGGGHEPLELSVRAPDGPWRVEEWGAVGQGDGGKDMTWSVPSLTEEVQYRLRWRDQVTGVHSLVPVPFPQFADVRYRVTPPAGTGLPEQETPGGGDVEALADSTVEIMGHTSDNVASAVLKVEGRPEAAFTRTGDGQFRAAFVAHKPGTFRWELKGPEGIADPAPADHKLIVLEDKAPTIDLLSPTFELEIGPQEELPVAFAATDDFGLRYVEFVYRAKFGGIDTGEEPVKVRGMEPAAREWIGEHRWSLLKFIPGTRVEFWLRAADTAKPPHIVKSAVNVLHIVDFESTHKDALTKREDVLKALRALAKEGEDTAESMASDPRDPGKDAASREKHEATAKDWAKALDAQKDAVTASENDPYLNPAVAPADKAVHEDLKRAAKDLLESARQSVQNGDWKKAADSHSQLAKEAEQAVKNMEAIGAYQDVKDMADTSQRLSRSGSQMEQMLKEAQEKGKPTDEDWKELDKQMKELREQMAQLAKTMMDFQVKAPSTMTGKEKVYQLPLQEVMQAQNALQEALARHDLAAAAKAAQELSKQLARMQKQLDEASGGMSPPEASRASKQMEDLLADWDKAVQAQEDAIAGLRPFEDERTKDYLEAQKRLLAELARRQRAVLAREGELHQRPLIPEVKGAMQRAALEFEASRVERAPALLEDAVARLRLLAPSRPEDQATLDSFRREEEEILQLLGKGAPSKALTGDRREALIKEGPVETGVRERIQGLQKRISDLRKEAVHAPREIVEKLKGAEAEAGEAVQSLEGADSKAGLEHEQKALELLQQGKDQAESAAQEQGKMESLLMLSKPGSSPAMRRMPGGANGNQQGSPIAPVKLPSALDYQPPQEIRRQVLESLQEKMPPAKAPEIKKYLKKVAE